MMDRIPEHDRTPIDLSDGPSKWALMALDPTGKRQLLVRRLVAGYESDAMVFRELGGDKLSVAKWNKKARAAAKMERADREVRVARLLASSGQAARFARLLASQDLVGGYRESWWQYYNVGDCRDLTKSALRFSTPPLSLVFRCLAQCLEGIQCLNELDIRHMDLHAGNVFLHLPEGASYPDAIIGDFGYSRFPGERPPKLTTEELGKMSSEEKEARLSPRLTAEETYGTEDWNSRLCWDLDEFRIGMTEVFRGKKSAKKDLLFSFFKRMADMCKQDAADRGLPEDERPPIQDLTELIQDARTLERLYAATSSDKKALAEMREKLLKHSLRESLEPRIFDDEEEARDEYEKQIDAGMLRVVNLDDKTSIEVAEAQLTAHKVKDSSLVSDHSDKSSSDNSDSASPPPSSKTRESTPAGSSDQHVTEQDSVERRVSPTPSHASTHWTPATRGLAEATAFAAGNASAVEAVLAVRDAEERRQALVRNEHARRPLGQRLSELFRQR